MFFIISQKMDMRKKCIKAIVFFICLSAMVFALTSCNESNIMTVDTSLTANNNFSGQQQVNITFPESITKSATLTEKLEKIIKNSCPSELSFSKLNSETTSYSFILDFDSKNDYCEKIKKLIGYEPIVAFGVYNNILTNGWSLYEDFDTIEMLKWLETAIKDSEEKRLELVMQYNQKPVVTIDGSTGESKGSTNNIYASKMTGYPVHSVEIHTTNYKNKTYDRKIILSFPESTYEKLGEELEEYISGLAGATSSETWTKSGNYRVFEAFYEKVDYATIGNYTSALLSCAEESVVYGDLNNSSTALAQQLVFEEKLNILGFIPEKDKEIELKYSYTLPALSSSPEGLSMTKGEWKKVGKSEEGKYVLTSQLPALNIRIPDGVQYSIMGINIELNHIATDSFSRIVSFVYSPDEAEGFSYACNFFRNAGAAVVTSEPDGEKLVCSLVFEGSSSSISEQMGKIFGGGNFISLDASSSITSVATKLKLSDNINMEYMLSENNGDAPITYTFVRKNDEHISRMNVDGNDVDVNKSSLKTSFKLSSGNASVVCSGSVANGDGITFCCIVFSMILTMGAITVLMLLRKTRMTKESTRKEEQNKKEDNM